jgi:toxin YoeB
MRSLSWKPVAWDDYIYWQTQDKKTLNRINALVKDIQRNGNTGLGHPEPLKNSSDKWSRKIDDKNRLVYRVTPTEVEIAECRGHYNDKYPLTPQDEGFLSYRKTLDKSRCL